MDGFESGVSAGSPSASVTGDTSAGTPTASSGGASPSEFSASHPSVGQDSGTPTTSPAAPGPIPYERFREVNERMKTAEQRWQRIQEQYGELVDPNAYRQSVSLINQLKSDPVTFATNMLSALAADEQHRPAIASQAARVLQGLRGATPREEPEPQPDLVAENGAPVFSAQQLRAWQEWQVRQIRADFQAQLAQATQPVKEFQKERAVAQVRAQAETAAGQIYERAKTWQGFKDHEAEIAQVWNQHPDWQLQDAYLHVLHTKILPALPAQAQARVVADLQQKAAAQSLNPSGATRPSTPDFKGDFLKALEFHSRK